MPGPRSLGMWACLGLGWLCPGVGAHPPPTWDLTEGWVLTPGTDIYKNAFECKIILVGISE